MAGPWCTLAAVSLYFKASVHFLSLIVYLMYGSTKLINGIYEINGACSPELPAMSY